MTVVEKLIARALVVAKKLGLPSVVPHALFIALYESDKSSVDSLLIAAGVDPAAYCQNVADETNAICRRGGTVRTPHPVTASLSDRSAAW